MSEDRWRKPNERETLWVYRRRQLKNAQQHARTTSEVQLQGEQHRKQQSPVIDEVNSYESEPFVYDDSLNLPIARGKAS
jgi:hypothetical protein